MTQAVNAHHAITEHNGTLKIKLSGSTGEEHLKTSFMAFVASAIEKGTKNLLIHNHELAHHVSPQFQHWAQHNLELPLFHAGVDKIAIVHPNDSKYLNLIAKRDTARRRYFENENDANEWLNS